MRKNIVRYLIVLALGMLVSAGCAKKEIVKPTEEPTPSAKPATTAPEVQPTRPEPTRPEPVTETPAREVPVAQETPRAAETGPTELQSQLQKIYFNFDSADLSQDSRNILSKNADLLMKSPSLKIRVEGNCDERGSDDYNMALGERRAKAARDYLINLGVQPERISIISYGEEKPADPGHDEAAWAKNRRDEFVIVQ